MKKNNFWFVKQHNYPCVPLFAGVGMKITNVRVVTKSKGSVYLNHRNVLYKGCCMVTLYLILLVEIYCEHFAIWPLHYEMTSVFQVSRFNR